MNKEFIEKFKRTYPVDSVLSYLDDVSKLKVICIGEIIFDEYQFGYALGKTGKFPIVAFKNEKLERYNGGVIATLNHLRDFCYPSYHSDGNAVVKKRYIQDGQKLFETYSMIDNKWANHTTNFENFDFVLVNDFGHGMMNDELREKVQDSAKYIALNTQSNAGNMGMNTINKYENADYICIDHLELRLAASNQFDDLEDIIKDTFEDGITVAITLSKDGCIIYKDGEIHRIPAFTDKVVDAIGAGDAFLAITSLLTYIDTPAEIIGFIGNCVGAMACQYQGNKKYITKNNLCSYIKLMYR